MKRSEVTAEALKRMGYKAMVEYISWNDHTERECNEKQSAELFELVARAARTGGKVEIRRNHIRGTVIAHVDGTSHEYKGAETYYFLQRDMTEAEIMEESIRSDLWVNKQ